MRLFYLYLSLFFSLTFFGQSSNSFAIKIYLEDDETSKNICDAKVTLEGFEIPAISGKYDKKGKFYYFNEIPKSYNTVMVYHKEYNEKGFQDKDGLPKELRLNLCKPLNVAIECPFPEQVDENKSKRYNNDYFVEDPYKIAIKINTVDNCKYVESIIKSGSLRFIDALKDFNKNILNINKFSCDSSFVFGPTDSKGDIIQIEGYREQQLKKSSLINNDVIKGDLILFLRKKDGTKFKRFNDPIIKNLRMQNLIVQVITYNRINYFGNKSYKSRYAKINKEVRRNDRKFLATPDSIKPHVLFYGNANSIRFITTRENAEIRYNDKTIIEFKILQYDDLGLGIYDQYDYFIKQNGKTFDLHF